MPPLPIKKMIAHQNKESKQINAILEQLFAWQLLFCCFKKEKPLLGG